jgi:ATP-dependent protease HslVU (ClpYQ) peptidase subunit
MTTIACKGNVMACDSMVSTGDCWWPATKVYRLPGVLIGGAGEAGAVRQFVNWYSDGQRMPHPKTPDTWCALVLTAEGLSYWASNFMSHPVERGFHAIGSGGSAALGALLAGANVQKAVEIACQVDTSSGGDVVLHKLGKA